MTKVELEFEQLQVKVTYDPAKTNTGKLLDAVTKQKFGTGVAEPAVTTVTLGTLTLTAAPTPGGAKHGDKVEIKLTATSEGAVGEAGKPAVSAMLTAGKGLKVAGGEMSIEGPIEGEKSATASVEVEKSAKAGALVSKIEAEIEIEGKKQKVSIPVEIVIE